MMVGTRLFCTFRIRMHSLLHDIDSRCGSLPPTAARPSTLGLASTIRLLQTSRLTIPTALF